MTKRAAIYTRISRDREGAGLGVDRQEQDCRELAARHCWPIEATFIDNDLSAYSGKPRPGYLAMLDAIRQGAVDAVLAWHTDRLHRSPAELEEYIGVCDARGVPTLTVKAGPLDLSTPSGRMVARQLGAVARYEVEHAIERQQRAKLQAATDGRWKGGRRPYGFEHDGVTVRPGEAAEVLRASEAILSGASILGIVADMNARGLVTSSGRPWRQDAVRRVLLRPRNAGLMEHRGEVIGPANWPAIVPEDTWRAVVAVLTNPGRRTQLTSVRRWQGSGLYRCGCPVGEDNICGDTVRATISASSARGRAKPAYVCRTAKHLARTCDEVDQFIGGLVVARLNRPDAAQLLARDARKDTSDLHTQALALRQRLDELAGMYADGAIDARQLREGSERLRRQLEQVEAEIADAARGSVLAGLVGVPNVAEVWASLGLDRQRAVIDALMTVTLLPSGKGRPAGWQPGQSYFRPDSVRITWKT